MVSSHHLLSTGCDNLSYTPVLRSPDERKRLKRKIPELLWVERLIRKYPQHIRAKIELSLKHDGYILPIYSLSLGNIHDESVPALFITGAVHGVERIGTEVILSWLSSLLERLEWQEDLHIMLKKIRIVIVPMVNPVGVYASSRCNGRGVDLNRNSPVIAEDKIPFLGGGQRISRILPWYRGKAVDGLEEENKCLERILQDHIFNQSAAFVLDVHSGFGMRDRLWFPYAFRKKPIGNIDKFLALKLLWERSFPHHNYVFEPQSLHYLVHGDIWDYFYMQSKAYKCASFMPLTLELGSWAWVKKRPQQVLNFAGLFNPQKRHRHLRVLRSHIIWMDFLLASAVNHQKWMPQGKQSDVLKQAAKAMWFE